MIKITEKSLADLEFPVVREQISELCVTDPGKAKALEITPYKNYKKTYFGLHQTNEYVSSKMQESPIPNHGFDQINNELKLLNIEETILEVSGFRKIAGLSETVNTQIRYFNKFQQIYPNLHQTVSEIEYTTVLIDQINKIVDRFVEMALDRAKKIKFGDPMDLATELGTVVNAQAAELFDKRVSMAADEGAKILYHPGTKGALLPPIVIDHVNAKNELVMEETFGPVIPIIRVPDEDDEVIKISNSTAFGLSSGVCTNNFMRAKKYIQNLNVGTVNIWEVPGYRIEMSPFGGIKDSGLGYKEGVIEAMKSFTNVKTFSLPW